VVVVVAAAAAVVVYKNTFVSHMTTGFEQKYEHDILIKKKKDDKVDWILKRVVYSIQINSVNPTRVGPGRCQIIKYF